uniref:Gag-Pol polyprotein n=1 Tax=Tanacetum cinerariifolium TaxID=118510 RepID=A0A699I720_TANCI|nr:Gag-Pol polyprotein [Tanacetum cinerariifolium]
MGTIRFGNDHFAAITGYGDYVQGNLAICHVYYVEGLGHNLFSAGKICDGDLVVAFHSNTFYVLNLEGDYLLTGSRESNLYTILIFELVASSPKMKPKADIGIFIGYSESSHGFRIYNCRTKKIMETIHVRFNELTAMASECNNSGPEYYAPSTSEMSKDSTTNTLDVENSQSPTLIIVEESDASQIVTSSGEPITQASLTLVLESYSNEHIQEDVAGLDRNTIIHSFEYLEFEEADSSSKYQDPSNEAMLDHSWIESMQDNLNQFKHLGVWELVPLPEGRNAIKVKWLWKNKKDAENIVIRNKSRLVAKGYSQQEGIDFEESFSPIA